MTILIRIHSGELFAINGRKCPAFSESKNIDGPVYDGAQNKLQRDECQCSIISKYRLKKSRKNACIIPSPPFPLQFHFYPRLPAHPRRTTSSSPSVPARNLSSNCRSGKMFDVSYNQYAVRSSMSVTQFKFQFFNTKRNWYSAGLCDGAPTF